MKTVTFADELPTPPLSPLSSSFSFKSKHYKEDQQSQPTKLRRPPAKRSLDSSSKSSKLKVNVNLHPLPTRSFALLNSPISPLSVHFEEQDISTFPTIDTKINTDSLMEDTSDYSSFSSESSSPEGGELNQYPRKNSILSYFPIPPERFQIALNSLEAEEIYLQARRKSLEAKERLLEASFAGTLLELQLEDIRFRVEQFKRVEIVRRNT